MIRSLLAFGLGLITAGAFAQTTMTYNYTGNVQTFVVPANVFSLTIDASGAEGAPNGTAIGGKGGRVQGTLSVNTGDTLFIYVGAPGVNSMSSTGVFNGGGGTYSYNTCGTAGTGGGGTDIRFNDTLLTDRMIVAGGGGGAGGYVSGNQTYNGGDGGGLIGVDGVFWPTYSNSGGKGGTQSAGGAGGVACCSCPTYTTSGALALGGTGSGDCAGGGGGGGGYYGGGGACFGAGGGGSSYTSVAISAVTHTQGYKTGDGIVMITYTPSASGIESSVASSYVNIFPNPFNDFLSISTDAKTLDVTFYDVSGKQIKKVQVHEGTSMLKVEEFLPGVYFLELSLNSERKVLRIVKTK